MYYLSTDPDMNVVKHILEQGNKNRVIQNSKIPNQHLISSYTRKLQGQSLQGLTKKGPPFKPFYYNIF